MPYLDSGQENSSPIELCYEDHGSEPPVVLIHGYPLSVRAGDRQLPVLLSAGRQVITYENPEDLPASLFDGFMQAARADCRAWMKDYWTTSTASICSAARWTATRRPGQLEHRCYRIRYRRGRVHPGLASPFPRQLVEDRRPDADRARRRPVPALCNTGERRPDLIEDVQLVVVASGPHEIAWTHADQVNQAVLRFLG